MAGSERNAIAGLGIAQRRTHNATPEEDYRTALLFDSPDAGCSLCGWWGTGERPGRAAGLRYSAGRAPRGCGRSILRCPLGAPVGRARTGNEGLPLGRPEAPTAHDSRVMNDLAPRGQRMLERQNKQKTYPVAGSLRITKCRSCLKYRENSPAAARYGGRYGNRGRMWVRTGGRVV